MPSKIVNALKDKAYHTRAADMSWSLSGLDLTDEQKKAIKEANDRASSAQPAKPGW